jgi:hypothetical protein
MLSAPIELAYMPVMRAARLGAQTPALENIRVKRTPSRASWSSTGVSAIGSP